MTQKELNKVLENHQHWLRKDCKGWENMRAVLDCENLDKLNLKMANLDGASFRKTSLYKANLDGASIRWALLDEAILDNASLHLAKLDGTVLDNASLNGASFDWASLRGASLKGISFNGISLKGAHLDGAKNLPFIPFACPDTGAFIGWKKLQRKIIKLEIPADAKRCSATSEKCRCDKAKVLEIQNLNGTIANIKEISSNYDKNFIYKVGEVVSVKNFCDDRWQECSEGIHFFVNRQSAVEY